jgi:hypothetical protein
MVLGDGSRKSRKWGCWLLYSLVGQGGEVKRQESISSWYVHHWLRYMTGEVLIPHQMHLLTSSIFLPAYMTPLSIPHRRTILRTYLLVLLLTALARGRPKIDFEYLMAGDLYPVAPHTEPKEWNLKHVISDPTNPEGRNPWLSLVESSLYHHGHSFSTPHPRENTDIRLSCPQGYKIAGPLRLKVRFPPPWRVYWGGRCRWEGSPTRDWECGRNDI